MTSRWGSLSSWETMTISHLDWLETQMFFEKGKYVTIANFLSFYRLTFYAHDQTPLLTCLSECLENGWVNREEGQRLRDIHMFTGSASYMFVGLGIGRDGERGTLTGSEWHWGWNKLNSDAIWLGFKMKRMTERSVEDGQIDNF